MKRRTWPVLILGFGSLVVLIAISGIGAVRRSRESYARVSELHERFRRTERVLSEVRSDIHVIGLLARDYLLDPSHISAPRYRARLLDVRNSMTKDLQELHVLLGEENAATLERLHAELEGYWDAFDPLFEWTPQQKAALAYFFLRKQVLPRRDAALELAQQTRDLAKASLEQQQLQIDAAQNELAVYMSRMAAVMISLGLLIAALTIVRITRLERSSELQLRKTEMAERELRRLSQQLVQAQEDERRSLSRELHDEVGQMLTALRMEFRNLQELRSGGEAEFNQRLDDAKSLSEQALRTVRHLAMGLRPSILDDLGLGPALQWQAREFSRHFGIPVTVQLEGPLAGLPERHRTCLYRVVQEALTNCARHAQARNIRVTVHSDGEILSATVQDDGVGFDASGWRGDGLGLLGMEERVRELDGEITVSSHVGKGAVLAATIPLPKEAATT